jgi:hypothetical protein
MIVTSRGYWLYSEMRLPCTYDDILEAHKNAWNFLIDDPDHIRSIGSHDWACVNL